MRIGPPDSCLSSHACWHAPPDGSSSVTIGPWPPGRPGALLRPAPLRRTFRTSRAQYGPPAAGSVLGCVARAGDVEQVEDLSLQGNDVWLEGLDVAAVVLEFVTGEVGEDLQDAFG